MARGDQLARQWTIVQWLMSSRRGKTVSDLAVELGCHQRTVYRDLEALQAAGFPLYTRRENGVGVWALVDTVKRQIPLPMSLTELIALYFSRDLIKNMRHDFLQDALDSLFGKIRSTLPPDYVGYLDKISRTFYTAPMPYKPGAAGRGLIDDLNQAIVNNRYLRLTYFAASKEEETRRTVAPYKIWFFNGAIYLVGYCRLRKAIRIFALDRIKHMEVSQESFTPEAQNDIDALMQTSFGVFVGKAERVRILFAARTANTIRETVWHHSQKLFDDNDGSIRMEMEVAVSNELKQWILGWGAGARVLEPESLRADIQAEAAAVLKEYNPA